MGKIDFEIFNFLDESEDSEHFPKNFELFLKKSIFENFTSVSTHFTWGKNIEFQIFNFLDESLENFISENFLLIASYEENIFSS